MTERLDVREINARLAGDVDGVLAVLDLPPENRALSTRAWRRYGRKGSLRVQLTGPGRGHWNDFEQGTGGDLIALVAASRGVRMGEAIRWARDFLGMADGGGAARSVAASAPRLAAESDGERDRKIHRAARLAASGRAIAGTAAAAYLAGRGIPRAIIDQARELGFVEQLCHHPGTGDAAPAMLASIRANADGTITGVHCTWLARRRDGRVVKAPLVPTRKVFGGKQGGAIRLMPPAAGVLGLAEGIETALSAATLFRVPCWAALDVGNLVCFRPPAGITALRLFADGDEPGLVETIAAGNRPATAAGCAMARAVGAWRAAGLAVTIDAPEPRPGGKRDWNDVLMAGGGVS